MLTKHPFDLLMLCGGGVTLAVLGLLITGVSEGTPAQNSVAYMYGMAFIAIGGALILTPFAKNRVLAATIVVLMLVFAVCGTEATLNLCNEMRDSHDRLPTISQIFMVAD